MSEKSFAITSITAAVICGTFFYPPPPAGSSSVNTHPAAVNNTAAPHKPVLAQKLALLVVTETAMQEGDATKLSAATPDVQAWGPHIASVGK